MEINNIWDNFLNKVKTILAPMLYDAWFSETKLISLNDNKATVLVPLTVHKKHLTENYNNLIENTFNEVTGSNFIFNYLTKEEFEQQKDEKIIAIAKKDPFLNTYNDITELPEHISSEIKHFFEVYKQLEYRETVVEEILGKEAAKETIQRSIENYKKKFVDKNT